MNERIKQITGQVLDEIVPDTWTTLGYDKIKQIQYRTAELIVGECVGICECEWNGDADTFAASEAYNECADAIKEHFGVQE